MQDNPSTWKTLVYLTVSRYVFGSETYLSVDFTSSPLESTVRETNVKHAAFSRIPFTARSLELPPPLEKTVMVTKSFRDCFIFPSGTV